MAISWNNEPAGSVLYSDWPMASTLSPWVDQYASGVFTTETPTPSGDNRILLQHHYPSPPGSGAKFYANPGIPGLDTLWMGISMRLSDPFAGYPSGVNKFFWTYGEPPEWMVLTVHNSENWPNATAYPVCFTIEPSGPIYPDNSHLGWKVGLGSDPDYTVRLYGEFQRSFAVGTWLKVECLVKLSTTVNSYDGIVRWWVNDYLIGNYTNVNNGGREFAELQITHTWDGMTVNPYQFEFRFDHVRVSFPGEVSPPPNPPTGTIQLSVR